MTICGWFVVVRHNALSPLLCFAPADQAETIDTFRADPLYAVTPPDGRLTEEEAKTHECDAEQGGSPLGPQFAEVRRRFTTPQVYGAKQLQQTFGPAAEAAGWQEMDRGGEPAAGTVRFCKRIGERSAHAGVYAHSGPVGPELELVLSAGAVGSTCDSPTPAPSPSIR
ncbi:MAG: hypothetical protein HOV76_22895 [Hamadaea sp.]|nr:hypothetical protein [Hamadaea sp.]